MKKIIFILIIVLSLISSVSSESYKDHVTSWQIISGGGLLSGSISGLWNETYNTPAFLWCHNTDDLNIDIYLDEPFLSVDTISFYQIDNTAAKSRGIKHSVYVNCTDTGLKLIGNVSNADGLASTCSGTGENRIDITDITQPSCSFEQIRLTINSKNDNVVCGGCVGTNYFFGPHEFNFTGGLLNNSIPEFNVTFNSTNICFNSTSGESEDFNFNIETYDLEGDIINYGYVPNYFDDSPYFTDFGSDLSYCDNLDIRNLFNSFGGFGLFSNFDENGTFITSYDTIRNCVLKINTETWRDTQFDKSLVFYINNEIENDLNIFQRIYIPNNKTSMDLLINGKLDNLITNITFYKNETNLTIFVNDSMFYNSLHSDFISLQFKRDNINSDFIIYECLNKFCSSSNVLENFSITDNNFKSIFWVFHNGTIFFDDLIFSKPKPPDWTTTLLNSMIFNSTGSKTFRIYVTDNLHLANYTNFIDIPVYITAQCPSSYLDTINERGSIAEFIFTLSQLFGIAKSFPGYPLLQAVGSLAYLIIFLMFKLNDNETFYSAMFRSSFIVFVYGLLGLVYLWVELTAGIILAFCIMAELRKAFVGDVVSGQ